MDRLSDYFAWTPQLWIGAALLLTVLELLLGSSFVLLCIGAACGLVGMVLWVYPSLLWQSQVFFFGCTALGSVVFWWHYLRGRVHTAKPSTLNRRAEQYVGRTFSLSEPIVNGRGKIRVDDSSWQVMGPDLPVGTKVEITGTEGVFLKAQAKNL